MSAPSTARPRPRPAAAATPPASSGRRSVTGVVATLLGLAVASLVGELVPGGLSPLRAVGDVVVNRTPATPRETVIGAVGTYDKPLALACILLVVLALGSVAGRQVHRWRACVGVVAVSSVAAGVAVAVNPLGTAAGGFLVAVTGGLVTVLALRRLNDLPPLPGLAPDAPRTATRTAAPTPRSRRAFLALVGQGLALAGALQVGASVVGRRAGQAVSAAREALTLPKPAAPLAPAPAGASLDVAGATPLFTPTDAFYRIDTALVVPQIDPATWSMTIGPPDAPALTLTYDDLLAMPQVERDVTLICVSNEVGGDLVGNARWQGVDLRTLLARAGVPRSGVMLVGRSVDGFTAGFPVELLDDDRPAVLAVAMNGEPLPAQHGFPARLVIGGLYGYVSATKWLSGIDVVAPDSPIYWTVRGWEGAGPVETTSRIDVPAAGAVVRAGMLTLAGTAWAQPRGIAAVEVSVDGGAWFPAELAEELTPHTWRMWKAQWQATPGRHRIEVRARDGQGGAQDANERPVYPGAATGLHVRDIVVSA